MFESALAGIRVLDISQGMAGPLCAKLLGDYGADVLKIEPPQGGDVSRSLGPFFHDDPHPEKSLLFFFMNLNKQGVTLNLQTDTGRRIFRELARNADVVVEGYRPGYLASLGLDHTSLLAENPSLVMTSITPFGQTGPYSQYEGEELIEYAMSGNMGISGTTDREPLKHGLFQAQYAGGLNGALATNMALLAAQVAGQGQHVDVSITECMSSQLVINQPYYSFLGAIQTRRGPRAETFGEVMPCKDGHVIIQTGPGSTWQTLADFLGEPRLMAPHLVEPEQRIFHMEEADSLMLGAIKERGKWELFNEGSKAHLLMGVVQGPEELAQCPQLESRGFYIEVEHPIIGRIRCPGELVKMSETPYQVQRTAPLLGQHNYQVFCETLGYSKADLVRLRQSEVI